MPINLNFKVKQNPKVIKKVLEGKVYIFTQKDLNLHSFNEVASFIWLVAKKPVSVEELVTKVVKEFETSESVAQKDVKEFVSYCLKNKFLMKV